MHIVNVENFFSTQNIFVELYEWKELNGEYKILPCKWSAQLQKEKKRFYLNIYFAILFD